MKPQPSVHSTAAEIVEAIAASWVVRLDEGHSAKDMEEFERWRRADVGHAAAFARIQATRRALGQLAQIQHRPEVGRIARDAGAARRRRRRLLVFPLMLAAAAAVAIAFYSSPLRVRNDRPLTGEFVARDAVRQVTLSDGSKVELNAGSRLEMVFTATERRVTLMSGEAHFSVTKNPARPFVVVAGGVAVRAVGTAFNVRLTSDAAVEVLVTEGKVQLGQVLPTPAPMASVPLPATTTVTASEIGALLEAGHRAVVTTRAEIPASTVEAVDQTEIDRALAWHTSSLVFAETPLSDVLAQFNRRNRVQLVLGDDRLAARPVSGNIRVDNAETFAGLLESGGDIAADRSEPGRIVLRKAR